MNESYQIKYSLIGLEWIIQLNVELNWLNW